MAVISALPDAVDESLIIGVDCDRVLALGEIVGHVDLVVIVAEMVGGGRALRDEATVDIQLVVVNFRGQYVVVAQTEYVIAVLKQLRQIQHVSI